MTDKYQEIIDNPRASPIALMDVASEGQDHHRDQLVNHWYPGVRERVAYYGNTKHRDLLVHDNDLKVIKRIAIQGNSKHLDILVQHPEARSFMKQLLQNPNLQPHHQDYIWNHHILGQDYHYTQGDLARIAHPKLADQMLKSIKPQDQYNEERGEVHSIISGLAQNPNINHKLALSPHAIIRHDVAVWGKMNVVKHMTDDPISWVANKARNRVKIYGYDYE